jgi:hypothetical protein
VAEEGEQLSGRDAQVHAAYGVPAADVVPSEHN